jgi:hypothetical protein
MAGLDRVTAEVHLAVDFDQCHGAPIAGQHCEHDRTQLFALQRQCVRDDGRNRRRTAAPGDAKAVHEVLGIDAGPHDDPQLRELRTHLAEFYGEHPLRRIELGCPSKELVALRIERVVFLATPRDFSVARWITNSGHEDSRDDDASFGGSRGSFPTVCWATAQIGPDPRNVSPRCATYLPQPVVEDSREESRATGWGRRLALRVGGSNRHCGLR